MIRFNHYTYRSVEEVLHKALKNMNPQVLKEFHKHQEEEMATEDLFMIPMVPLIRRRLAGERIWVRSSTS